jgi:RimJ/RimL family protein N-acetyltransferase
MSRMDGRQLIDYLWPQGDSLSGPQVHLLLDGARDPAAVSLIRFGKLEYSCLFGGPLTPRLQAAAPYLVHLAARSPLTLELLSRVWGRGSGILTVARADVTLEQQRLHFKKFLRVRDEDGRLLQFRYYDPRVLRIYLPTCTADELQRFFGPLSRIVMEPVDGAAPLDYALRYGGLAPGREAAGVDPAPVRDAGVAVCCQPTEDMPGHGPEALDIAALGLHHALSYRRLQNDEDVRRCTGLPLHVSVEDARNWIRRQLARSEAGLCVVRHPDLGIVGALALEQRGPAALGYCWIGKEFRGRGYGHAVLALLRDFARGRGVRRLYARAGADNAAALKLLLRAGALPAIGGAQSCYVLAVRDAAYAAVPEFLSHELSQLLRIADGDALQGT